MAQRAARARAKMAAVARAVPGVAEVAAIVKFGHSAGLKLNNAKALTAAADNISLEALKLIANYDGEKFSSVDKLIPAAAKYKGKPKK